jgi:hypothetical protein
MYDSICDRSFYTVFEMWWHTQKPDFVFRRNGEVHLNRRGLQFIQLLAAMVCTSVVVMLDTPYSEVVWRVLAAHAIRQFPLHFHSRVSPCAITFQLDFTKRNTRIIPLNLTIMCCDIQISMFLWFGSTLFYICHLEFLTLKPRPIQMPV